MSKDKQISELLKARYDGAKDLAMKVLCTFIFSYGIVGYGTIGYLSMYFVADENLMIGTIELVAPEVFWARISILFVVYVIIFTIVWVVDWIIQKHRKKKGGAADEC